MAFVTIQKDEFQYPKVRLKVGYFQRLHRRFTKFQYPKVRLKVDEYKNFTLIQKVSIPEGAIEGQMQSGQLVGYSEFQYPKVRLKGGSGAWPQQDFAVSIPEGAIEGHVERLFLRCRGKRFNTRRCD